VSQKFARKISLVFSPGSASFFGHDATASLPHHSSIQAKSFAIFCTELLTHDTC